MIPSRKEELIDQIIQRSKHLDTCIIDAFKTRSILLHFDPDNVQNQEFTTQDMKAGIQIGWSSNNYKAFSLLRSSLISCGGMFLIFDNAQDKEKWDMLYQNHNRWIELALSDPLTSEHTKDFIRNTTRFKKIYRSNNLVTQIGKNLLEPYLFISDNFHLKKKDVRDLLVKLLFQIFPDLQKIIPDLENFDHSIEKALRQAQRNQK